VPVEHDRPTGSDRCRSPSTAAELATAYSWRCVRPRREACVRVPGCTSASPSYRTMTCSCRTSRRARRDTGPGVMPAVVDALATGTLDPPPLVDRVLGWEDAVAAFARGRGEAGRCATFVGDASEPDESRGPRTGCSFVRMRVSRRLSPGRRRRRRASRAHARSSSGRAVVVGATAARRERALRRWPETPGRVSKRAVRAGGRRRRRGCHDGRSGGGARTSGGWMVCRGAGSVAA
jgi:hypothetical protein